MKSLRRAVVEARRVDRRRRRRRARAASHSAASREMPGKCRLAVSPGTSLPEVALLVGPEPAPAGADQHDRRRPGSRPWRRSQPLRSATREPVVAIAAQASADVDHDGRADQLRERDLRRSWPGPRRSGSGCRGASRRARSPRRSPRRTSSRPATAPWSAPSGTARRSASRSSSRRRHRSGRRPSLSLIGRPPSRPRRRRWSARERRSGSDSCQPP